MRPPEHECTKHPDKVQYRTHELASAHAAERSPKEGVTLYVYACDHCGFFHLSRRRGTEDVTDIATGVVWTSQSNGYDDV